MFRANGTQEAPYIINMDYATRGQSGQTSYVEVTYKDEANFYFKIDGANSSGTYCVDWDKENKIVRFTYYSSANTVCYTRKNQNSSYYMQAGTTPCTTTATTDYASVEFKIETIEKCDGTIFYSNANGESKKERAAYVLKNAPLKNEPNVPHPSYFVFTKSGTAKELFDSVSKANCAETDFENKETVYSSGGLFGKNVAELIIDPRTVTKDNLPEMTIRYGDWNGSEVTPEVSNEENYKVNVLYHFVGDETEEEKQAHWTEVAVTGLLIMIGEVFMFAIRLFLGSTVTMDSIIFNRYDATVIDFRGRAGMFANIEVKNIINTMYSGFEWLAIIAFVVILLYIGIQIVLSVGTEKQSKYFKYLEHWVVGVAILFIFPRFFPYITDISNGIVSYLGKGATPMYTQYNVIAILDDEAVIGEDAQTVKIDELIGEATKARDEQIATLKKEIAKKESSNNIFYEAWLKAISAATDKMNGYNSVMEKDIYTYVDNNIDNWDYINEDEFEEKLKAHRNLNISCNSTYLEEKISKLVKYKNNSLEIKKLNEEILALENYTSSAQDLMSLMRAKAGKTGRIVYAVIWLILLIQMISLLAMYYKRMIMVAILVMIFPIVMIAYAIDKAGDGKAQTLETWTKEFTVNIIVQIAHAVVYVFLIQTGLEIYEANPDNWLFLVLAVMILFPMERLFRTLFGINGNTIGQLRSNIAGGIMLAKTAFDFGKGTGKLAAKGTKSAYGATKNLVSDIKNKGLGGTLYNRAKRAGKALENYDKNMVESRNATDRKRQLAAERKKNARDMNIQRRREQMEKAGLAKKAMLKTMNAASMVRNGMYYAGNVGRKTIRGVHKLQNSYAGKSLKIASNALRKGAGITAGTISGVTNAVVNSGKNGMTAGINQGVSVGKSINQIVGGAKVKSNKSKAKTQVPTTGSMPYHFKKNMPAGQKYTRSKKTSAQKVKNSATKTKTTKTRIKGVKKEIHEK